MTPQQERGRSASSSVFSLFKYAASTSCGQLDRHFTEPSTDISQALEPTIGSGVAGRSTRLRGPVPAPFGQTAYAACRAVLLRL